MWRGIVLAASVALLMTQAALGQDSTDAQATLRLQKYLRLHVTGGRIAVRHGEAGQSRTVTAEQAQSACRQQLHLCVRPPCVVVQYEATDPAGRLALRLCEKRNLVIERAAGNQSSGPFIRYEQPRTGPVKLTVAGQSSGEMAAASLWHLALLRPQECREFLFPLLKTLSPDWDLDLQAEELEAALMSAAAEADVAGEEKSWLKLVDDLSSERFAVRQSADAALQGGGQGAAAFLTRLDQRSMNGEQRLRIERICRSFEDGTTDTPRRVAVRLVGDRALWLGLLSSEEAAMRAAAADHLSRLVGRPIAFDPQADGKMRERQVAELARRIGAKK